LFPEADHISCWRGFDRMSALMRLAQHRALGSADKSSAQSPRMSRLFQSIQWRDEIQDCGFARRSASAKNATSVA
jgi:hypothetical protein